MTAAVNRQPKNTLTNVEVLKDNERFVLVKQLALQTRGVSSLSDEPHLHITLAVYEM